MAGIRGMVATAVSALRAETGRDESDSDSDSDFQLGLYNATVKTFTPRRQKGSPKFSVVLRKTWKINDLENYILSLYPGVPLHLTGFSFGKAGKNKKLKKITFESVSVMKKTLNRGRLFIIPRTTLYQDDLPDLDREEDVSLTNTETPTSDHTIGDHASTSAADTTIDMPSKEHQEMVSLTASQHSAETPNSHPTVYGEKCSKELEQMDLPIIERSRSSRNRSNTARTRNRRNAARIARIQINAWCNAKSPVPESPSCNSNATPSTTMEAERSSALDNMGLTVQELRAQQDSEFQQSLRADQEKDLRRRTEQIEITELQELRERRRQNLPPEPESAQDGFILKIRGLAQRRFRPDDKLEDLVNFVGSQENASKHFTIKLRLAHANLTINSWDSKGELKQAGIVSSAVLDVEWDAEYPGETTKNVAYEDLIEISDTSDVEISDEEAVLPVTRSVDCNEIRDVLTTWRVETIDLDQVQAIRVCRRPHSIWEHSLRCFQRNSFDVKKTLKVEFRNESGIDEGGIRREYFETLLRQMLCSPFFEDTGAGFEPTHNILALVEGQLLILGKMFATILVQGGPVMPLFSHTFLRYGICNRIETSIHSVPELRVQNIIEEIQNAEDLTFLSMDDRVSELLELAGIRKMLNENTKSAIVDALILHNSSTMKKQQMFSEFWRGAETLNMKTLLQKYPAHFEEILCFKCSSKAALTAERLIQMFSIEKYGDAQSNKRHKSEDVAQNFENFLFDCEEGKATFTDGVLSIQDVLKFLSGCSTVPPGGFDAAFTMQFTEESRYPSVSTCTLTLTLPLNLCVYDTFKKIFIESVVSGPGFGNV